MTNLIGDLLSIDENFQENKNFVKLTDIELLKEFSSGAEQRIKEVFKNNQKWKSIIDDSKKNNLLIKDLAKLDDKYIEYLYKFGYDMYKKGFYRDAFNIFRFLVIFDLSDFRFAYALARTLEALEYPLLAAQYYNISSGLDPTNPFPCYCAAECLLEVGDTYRGLLALEQCLFTAGKTPEEEELKERTLLVYQGVLAHIFNNVEKTKKKKKPAKKKKPDKK